MDEFIDEQKAVLKTPDPSAMPEVNLFAATNFRNQNRKFGIKLDDRRRHMYVVGKTGMGKTTMLENMILNDIYAGHGAGYVDPHGDTAEKILNYIPANRINDVVYFNPSDINFPIGFNILEVTRPEHKHLVASGLMGVFKKIWPDVWSARMEYILNNTILALLDYPGTTLLGINRMLADEEYRNKVVGNSKDPVVKAFWQTEFESYNDRYKQEAVAPIQNKIGQFLSASVIRNMVAQVKSRIDIRDIMDNRKILIMNLAKGRIGEDNSRLLGGMLITRIQLAAMERVEIPEKDRKDFFLYVDEFQNFATEAFANILSEARKYRLDLTMAHQYMEQLDELVRAAVIGNVGTTVTFRVGSTDAEILAKEFTPTFIEEDLVNLPKFQIYLKLMIDGVASKPFSATTLPPIASATGSEEKVVRVSRERYAISREKIEEKIMRWSGMGPLGEGDDDDDLPVDVPPKALLLTPAPKPAVQERPREPRQEQRQDSRPPKSNLNNNQQKTGNKPAQNYQSQNNQPKKRQDQPLPRRDDRRSDERSKINLSQAPVSIVDPNQKGISLNEAISRPKPKTEFKQEPPKVQVKSDPPKVEIKTESPKNPPTDQAKVISELPKISEPDNIVVPKPPEKPVAEVKTPVASEKIPQLEEQLKPAEQPKIAESPKIEVKPVEEVRKPVVPQTISPVVAEIPQNEPSRTESDQGLTKLQPGEVVKLP